MSILSRVLLGAVLLLAGIAVWQRGTVAQAERARDYAQTAKAVAEQERDNAIAVIAVERQRVKRAEAVATQYEQEKADAESKGAAVADGLRSRALRLQDRWAGCEARVSDLAASPSEPDGAADDRADSAGRIVRAAAACDAQVRGLQALVRADRE
ncbi:endopeptidase [Stenotrophomonas maltophilia]|uniref:endopeptidase n=1 Tax=Stenotrophomonas maltophilia TaxID=40324 RepID=UPI00244A5486|nr:endopeptidase [Stenotrophomonas maltophilia]MDG9939687.1 endopeptidase [Stenotrophomonas maltophilia]MDH0559494.1 endopeptidase [Stenotrophomonas maltophilia]